MRSRLAQRGRTKQTPIPESGGDDGESGDYRGGRLGGVVKDDERNDGGGEGRCEPVGVKTSAGVIVSARVGVKVRSSNKRNKYKIIKRISL
jgi:hypothetical protein